MTTLTKQIADLTAKMEPAFKRAFIDAAKGIRDRAAVSRLAQIIESEGAEAALDYMRITNADFSSLAGSMSAAYNDAGQVFARSKLTLKGYRGAVYQWDATRYEIVQAGNSLIGRDITRISADTRNAIANLIREGIGEGIRSRDLARMITGELSSSGYRVGGVAGLNDPQRKWVMDYRKKLQRLDPDYTTNTKRDRRFDPTINRAIREGKPLTKAQIDNYVARYAERLRASRAATIARTEMSSIVQLANYQAVLAKAEDAGVEPWRIMKEWIHAGHSINDRVQHVMIGGEVVYGMDTPFVMPDGTRLLFPHDNSLGAGANHICNCRCVCAYSLR